MYIVTNENTCKEIEKILASQEDKPKSVRIFIAGIGWGGPSLGLGLDEKKENDIFEEYNGITFLMEKNIYDQLGEISVTFQGNGYQVVPSHQAPSDCGSCSGC